MMKQNPWSWKELLALFVLTLVLVPIFIEYLLMQALTEAFGNNFHSANGLKILTSFHNYEGARIPYDETVITKDVVIEDNVWIGLDVIILGGVTIGEGAIIQAGSVVSQSIPALSIAGGNPARKFKERNREHYYALKKENKVF